MHAKVCIAGACATVTFVFTCDRHTVGEKAGAAANLFQQEAEQQCQGGHL